MFSYELADEVIRRIISNFSPMMIVVFGSAARHEAKEDSDLDILVVMETELDLIHRGVDIRRTLRDIVMPMDIIVVTPSEYEEVKDDPLDFVHEIVNTGRIVYVRQDDRPLAGVKWFFRSGARPDPFQACLPIPVVDLEPDEPASGPHARYRRGAGTH